MVLLCITTGDSPGITSDLTPFHPQDCLKSVSDYMEILGNRLESDYAISLLFDLFNPSNVLSDYKYDIGNKLFRVK